MNLTTTTNVKLKTKNVKLKIFPFFFKPINFQISPDGKKMIGHITLKRNNTTFVNSSSTSTIDSSSEYGSPSTSQSFGLKIVGGRPNTQLPNTTSAYVVKVKSDSIADTVGRIQIGDEVLKWNGISLRGLTYDEVFSITSKSRMDQQIELVIERLKE